MPAPLTPGPPGTTPIPSGPAYFDDPVAVGKARIEDKDNVMRDGDVVEFRHSATSKG